MGTLEKYRPSMTEDVLHSWAKEAQMKLDLLCFFVEGVIATTVPLIAETPEGKVHITKMRRLVDS